jgi:hypothetical protein
LLIHIITDKILINDEVVTRKSIFRSKSIKYSEIKTFGVYLQEPYSANYLDEANYNKDYWYRQKLIYISTKKDYDPIFSISLKPVIKFQYNKEIYAIIKTKCTTNNLTY